MLASTASLRLTAESAVTTWPSQTFITEPELNPPQLTINKAGVTSDGLLFLTPGKAALAMTDDGDLVWQASNPFDETFSNLGVQELAGTNVLTYWIGTLDPAGFGYGRVRVLNNAYEIVQEITVTDNIIAAGPLAENGSYIDLHESRLTPDGNFLVTAYNLTQTDLTSVGGPPDGWVFDALFYEIDLVTNQILFRWRALDHMDQIPLNSSHEPFAPGMGANTSTAWDWFHLNSITEANDGYLISSRHLWTAFYLWKNGTVKWSMQGQTGGDFCLSSGPAFSWQHHIRIENETADELVIHLHNNNQGPVVDAAMVTTGLILSVDQQAHQVEVIGNYTDARDPIHSTAAGSFELLPDGHVLLGHGIVPQMKEYDAPGNCIWTATFGEAGLLSYRGFRHEWQGYPSAPISVTVCQPEDTSNGNATLYVSWNGATEVTGWAVYIDEATDSRRPEFNKTGFETEYEVPVATSYQVVALNGENQVGESGFVGLSAC